MENGTQETEEPAPNSESTSPSTPPKTTADDDELIPLTILAPHGDLILSTKHNSNRARFLVASQILWVASPVFDRMIGPTSHFLEAKQLQSRSTTSSMSSSSPAPKPPTIALDTDPETLHLILRALHPNHLTTLPLSIPFSTLLKVAEIADKYELSAALRLIVELWVRSLLDREEAPTRDPQNLVFEVGDPADWVLVAWVFGYEEWLRKSTREIMVTERWTGVETMLSESVSEAVIEKMTATRASAVDPVYNYIPTLLQERRQKSKQGEILCIHGREECDALQLGHLLQMVDKHGLDPAKVSGKVDQRSRSLREMMDTFTTEISPMVYFCTRESTVTVDPMTGDRARAEEYREHGDCSWVGAFKRVVWDQWESIRGLSFAEFPSMEGRAVHKLPTRPVFPTQVGSLSSGANKKGNRKKGKR